MRMATAPTNRGSKGAMVDINGLERWILNLLDGFFAVPHQLVPRFMVGLAWLDLRIFLVCPLSATEEPRSKIKINQRSKMQRSES